MHTKWAYQDRSNLVEELEEDKRVLMMPSNNRDLPWTIQPLPPSGEDHWQRRTVGWALACVHGEFGSRKSFSAPPLSQYLFIYSSPIHQIHRKISVVGSDSETYSMWRRLAVEIPP